MPMLPITLEDLSLAVHEGFKAGINASDDLIQPDHEPGFNGGEFLLRRERDVTSKVIEQISRRLEYVQDPTIDTIYWAVRDGLIVYYNTIFSELDCPPADIYKWKHGAFEPTSARVAVWAELLGINGVRD